MTNSASMPSIIDGFRKGVHIDDNTVECTVNAGPSKPSNGMMCFSFAITKAISTEKTACVTGALDPAAPSEKTSTHFRGVKQLQDHIVSNVLPLQEMDQ
jgi:hypothetical protein